MDISKRQPLMTAGLDLGDKYSYLCLIDQESGEVMEEGRLRTNPETLRRRFASHEQPLRIAIETGTHSPWASRVLKECGHEVLVANARKLRLIYANKRKTDELDAENLARLARLNPKLLYPVEHRGEDSQAHMAIIRSRQALVGCLTQLVNHVRGAVKSLGTRLPKCPALGIDLISSGEVSLIPDLLNLLRASALFSSADMHHLQAVICEVQPIPIDSQPVLRESPTILGLFGARRLSQQSPSFPSDEKVPTCILHEGIPQTSVYGFRRTVELHYG